MSRVMGCSGLGAVAEAEACCGCRMVQWSNIWMKLDAGVLEEADVSLRRPEGSTPCSKYVISVRVCELYNIDRRG